VDQTNLNNTTKKVQHFHHHKQKQCNRIQSIDYDTAGISREAFSLVPNVVT
jgi:hypothetical protein